MKDQTPSPYQPGSFEHAVITGLTTLQTKMDGVSDELKQQKEALAGTIEKVHDIQLGMAERQNDCVVVKRLEARIVRRIQPLERDALVARANKKMIAAIATIISGLAVFVYHVLHSVKDHDAEPDGDVPTEELREHIPRIVGTAVIAC